MPHLDNPSFLEELEDKHSEKIMNKVEKHIDNYILDDISFKELHKLARNMLLVEWFNKCLTSSYFFILACSFLGYSSLCSLKHFLTNLFKSLNSSLGSTADQSTLEFISSALIISFSKCVMFILAFLFACGLTLVPTMC